MGDNIHVMSVFLEGWLCICVMHEIFECLCLLMIDVKLTPNGRRRLFVWMGRRHAGLVDCLLGELLEDSGSFLRFLSVRVLD